MSEIQNHNSIISSWSHPSSVFFKRFIFALAFIFLVYQPTISIPYFYFEDARFFEDRGGGSFKDLASEELLMGRYVISLTHYIFHLLPVKELSDLTFPLNMNNLKVESIK